MRGRGTGGSPRARHLADRFALARTLPAAGALVLGAWVAIRLASALVPAATAVAMSFLVHRILGADDEGMLVAALLPLAALGVVVLLGRAGQDLLDPLEFLAVQRIDGAHHTELVRLAATTETIDVLERPHVRALLQVARARPESSGDRTPGQGAVAQLALVLRHLGVIASCLVLARYALWLVPLVLVPGLAARAVWRQQARARMRLRRDGVIERIRGEHWKRLATDWTGGKEVRTFGLGQWVVSRARRHMLTMAEPRWAQAVRNTTRQWQIAAIVGPPLAAAYLLVTWDTVGGGSTVPLQTAVLTAAWSLLQSLGQTEVVNIEAALPAVRARAELAAELTAVPREAAPTWDRGIAATAAAVGDEPPHVRFERVSFAYPGIERPVLDGFDLDIRPGELLALVGLNGAGKSTIIKLLAGLYRPTSGRITVNGSDLRTVDMAAWRAALAVVFQDFITYPLSASDNVIMGTSPPRRSTAFSDAVRDAGCGPLLAKLPAGWDTPLSRSRTGGTELSGGEWQHIALARALYAMRSGARLLVLDEPTAHLDASTELEVFGRLARARDGAGMVLISHRLSTVRQADRIALLEDGRITESGSHDELMALSGRYAELFTIQAARFHGDREDPVDSGATR